MTAEPSWFLWSLGSLVTGVMIQQLLGPTALPSCLSTSDSLSLLSYNVLLPNSVDGWWNYKMYHPPLTTPEQQVWSSWAHRRDLLRHRISAVDADVACLQEVAPVSFDDDFRFMKELGYDGHEMFKKGRFRPATFWKTSRVTLAADPVHKDRSLITAFRRTFQDDVPEGSDEASKPAPRTWYVLNCHLQAGKEGKRRLRQIQEGVKGVMTLARKLKDHNPERHIPLLVCGDFNGGAECGAVRFLEDGFVDESFREDGDSITSSRKILPLETPLRDAMDMVPATPERAAPPPTLVVNELISILVQDGYAAYENPCLSSDVKNRFERIYLRLASGATNSGGKVMTVQDVEQWLITINGALGRGSEFREAARKMGWSGGKGDDDKPSELPRGGMLSLKNFIDAYEAELKAGKFWGIAHDLAVLGEPLPDAGVFESRYDRIYCSAAAQPTAIMDFPCKEPCPNRYEPSDHLPIAASFSLVQT